MIDTVLHALAEPNRREILRLVGRGELTSGAIAGHFTISRPAISQHLAVLVEAGLLTVRRDGTKRLYKVQPEALRELYDFLSSFWDDQLTMLKLAAEMEERRARRDQPE
jgi:DNA-binding transcriptional ArsR family regulator